AQVRDGTAERGQAELQEGEEDLQRRGAGAVGGRQRCHGAASIGHLPPVPGTANAVRVAWPKPWIAIAASGTSGRPPSRRAEARRARRRCPSSSRSTRRVACTTTSAWSWTAR